MATLPRRTRTGFCSYNKARKHLVNVVICQERVLAFGKQKPTSQLNDKHVQRWEQRNWQPKFCNRGTCKLQQNVRKKISVQALLADLKACRKTQDLRRGKNVHVQAVACRHDSNIYVLSALIRMYTRCSSMVDARRVFDSIQNPDVVCWNCLLLGYTENGEGLVALEMFSRMKASRCAPDTVTYVAVLKACTSLAVGGDRCGKRLCLERGREIHLEIGGNMDLYIQSTLIYMYAKCGSTVDARDVFESIQKRNVQCWNALLLGYAENGEGLAVLDLFSRMKTSGCCAPDSITYVAALKACTSLGVDGDGSRKETCLEWGRDIHLDIGSNINHYVQNTLIDMYGKCGSMVDARRVFDTIQQPDVISWTALLSGYAENGQGLVALDMFSRMKAGGCAPNSVTYIAVLKACTSLAGDGDENGKQNCLAWGREIYSELDSNLDLYIQSTLIGMFCKCGSIVDARRVFDSIEKPDVVCWNALLLGYVENGKGLVVLDMFSRMKASGCAPDSVTYIAALKACTFLEDCKGKESPLELGRKIHSEIGSNLDHHVQNTLIDMYARCGSIADARHVFEDIQKPDVVSWTALLSGYAESGVGLAALDTFCRMKTSGCLPDPITYSAVLKACALVGALDFGRKVHSEITVFSTHVMTCLVDFYGKCGSMVEAHEVFDLHPKARDISTWNALLAGYGRFGDSDSVFKLFEAMQDEGFRPDAVTFVSILSCCSHTGLVEKAREYFEGMRLRYGVTPDVRHYSCMIDVLGRANLLKEAVGLLQKMPCKPDAVTWTSLLGACCKWKIGRVAFQSLIGKYEKVGAAHMLMADIHKDQFDDPEKSQLREYECNAF